MRVFAACSLLVLAQVPAGVAALAQADDGRLSPQFSKCMDAVDLGAGKNGQFEACYRAELKVQDRRLNEEYRKLQTRQKGEARTLLTNAQKAWMGYRDGWCRYVGTLDLAPSPEVNHAACLVELTADQVKRLKESGG